MVFLMSRHFAFLLAAWTFLASSAIADVVSDLNGRRIRVLAPGSAQYNQSSQAFNLRYTFQPAAIAYPSTVQEVSDVVKLGVRHNLKVVARSGGHSYIANGLGGKSGSLLVDMSNFKSITVDPTSHIATIGSGSRLGDIALALDAQGRALPHGSCPYVGIGGHSGYGGFGLTSRMWGLTLDTIDSLEVVLANGTIAIASQTQHPDLFWALRGSSPSFGIVTQINARTFAVPGEATIYDYWWDALDAAQGASFIAALQEFALHGGVPKEWSVVVNVHPAARRGVLTFNLQGGWYLPLADLEPFLQPLLNKLPPISGKRFDSGKYIDSLKFVGGGRLDTTGIPDRTDTFYAKSLMIPETNGGFREEARKGFMEYLTNTAFGANTNWWLQIDLFGGAHSTVNSVPLESTSFGHRNKLFLLQLYTSATTNRPPFPKEGFRLLDGMANSITRHGPANWDYGAYANYIDDRLPDWQKRFYGSQAKRLLQLRRVYDPLDTFSLPVTI